MDLESKLSSLKNFVQNSSSGRSGSDGGSSSTSKLSQSTNGQTSSWGNGWFKKAEEDPYLPSLVSVNYVIRKFSH